jgi:hypothetical protein
MTTKLLHVLQILLVAILLAFVLLIGLFSTCKKERLDSKWLSDTISIDGNDDEWQNAMTYLKDKDLNIGLFNDQDNLYLCLVVWNDKTQSRLVRHGLTVWFDNNGGTDKLFGIHFPLGRPEATAAGENNNAGPDPFDFTNTLALVNAQKEIELINNVENSTIKMLAVESKRVEAKIGYCNERLVFEFKVPLRTSDVWNYCIGTDTSRVIGIGFEIPKIKPVKGPRVKKAGNGPANDSLARAAGHWPAKTFPLWITAKIASKK